jgi:hypothetical protein
MVAMSRFLDERGRIFGKVNVVDILVLLAVAALIVFAVARTQGTSSTTVPVQVTIRVELVRQVTVDRLLKATGTIKDDGGTTLGKVEKVSSQPSDEEILNPLTGKLEKQASPLYQDVDIVVASHAVFSGGHYRIGSLSISAFKKLTIIGAPDFTEQAEILDVEQSK